MKTYLEYISNRNNDFWEIEVNGNSHTVRYGIIGSNGQEITKDFESEEKAQEDAYKLIEYKKERGYEEHFIEIEREKRLKEEKITKIAEGSIKLFVKTLMKQKGYSYAIEEKRTCTLLRIQISVNRFVEFDLPHKGFVNRINKIIPTFETIKENFYEDDRINNFILDSAKAGLSWNENTVYGIDSMYFSEKDITDEFWSKHCREYCEKTLLDGKKSDKWHTIEFYQKITKNAFPKLEKKTEQGRIAKYQKIHYYINDICLLEIQNAGLSFKFFNDYWNDDLHLGVKSLENEWHRFLDGFADFYIKNLTVLEKEIKVKKKEYEKTVSTCNKFCIAVKEILNRTNYVYELFIYKDVGKLYLYIPTGESTVLNMQFKYDDFQNKLNHILPNIEIVEKTLKKTKLSFNFFDTKDPEYKDIQWKIEK